LLHHSLFLQYYKPFLHQAPADMSASMVTLHCGWSSWPLVQVGNKQRYTALCTKVSVKFAVEISDLKFNEIWTKKYPM